MRQDDWQDWEGPDDKEVSDAFKASVLVGVLIAAAVVGIPIGTLVLLYWWRHR